MKLGLGLGLSTTYGGGGSQYLDSVVASAQTDLDARITGSYSSGETWNDLLSNMSMWFGAAGTTDGDEPTFSGSGSIAKFTFDGGDFFNAKTVPSYLNKVLRTDQNNPVTFIFRGKFQLDSLQYFIANGNIGADANAFGVRLTTSGNITYFGRASSTNQSFTIASGVISDDTTHTIGIAWDAGAGTGTYWVDSDTGTSFTPSFGTSTADIENPIFNIGSYNNGSVAMDNGGEIVHFSYFNEVLSNSNFALVRAMIEGR